MLIETFSNILVRNILIPIIKLQIAYSYNHFTFLYAYSILFDESKALKHCYYDISECPIYYCHKINEYILESISKEITSNIKNKNYTQNGY